LLLEEKTFIRIGLIAVKASLQIIRMLGGRVPDATILGRVFSSTCHSAIFFRGDQHEHLFHKAMVDIFMETEPHVFQEVWSTNMEMFFDLMTTSPGILNIVEMLYRAPSTSYSLTALILRHLVDNLESLLENNSLAVAVVIRLLKQTFQSVANLSDGSERVIFPYLPRLLVDVFPMAARSQDPRNFLSVPFYLFRALGVRAQSARFEALHKEVYPLLPELLDGVNRSLELTDEPVQREQLVEIALTTPARLQHLAPYITHLWRPLVLALGSKSTELLKQGLRTLELTVENINNVDLLDPTNEPVARELVLALHKVLKPGQATAETAQQASRILGKIGGKNRRIMSFPPSLPYNPSTAPAVIPVEFTSHTAALQVGPACEVAGKVLEDAKASVHHEAAFNLLRAQILYLLQTVSRTDLPFLFNCLTYLHRVSMTVPPMTSSLRF
jgi:transformation/transcription domain-associated protein